MPASSVSLFSEKLVWTSAESRIWVNRILEIDDNPLGTALFITGHANRLLDQAQAELDAGQLPKEWLLKEPPLVLGKAKARIDEIVGSEQQLATDYESNTHHRYLAVLTQYNTRRYEMR